MRRRRTEGGGGSYWPGYVDALTNVVLNLLFLIAIFAAGVFSIGMQVSRSGPTQVREVLDILPVTPVPRIAVMAEDAPAVENGRRVVLANVRQVAGEPVAAIGFAASAVTVPEADRAALEAALQPLLADGVEEVRVWAVVDVADAVSRRASYLRVMAIRDLLRTLSIHADDIDMRLVSGGVRGGSGQMVYVLVRSRAEASLKGDSQ